MGLAARKSTAPLPNGEGQGQRPALERRLQGLGQGGRDGRVEAFLSCRLFWGDSFTATMGLFPRFRPFHHPARGAASAAGPWRWS